LRNFTRWKIYCSCWYA